MSKKHDHKNLEETTANKGAEAYDTLVEWVKTVPGAIEHIKKNGTNEDLLKYKQQIKLVLEKIKDIEKELNQ